MKNDNDEMCTYDTMFIATYQVLPATDGNGGDFHVLRRTVCSLSPRPLQMSMLVTICVTLIMNALSLKEYVPSSARCSSLQPGHTYYLNEIYE